MLDYSQSDKGSQCLGKHTFRYAVMPHTGDWEKAKIWQAAERLNLAFVAAQVGPTVHGREPLSKSFLEIKPDILPVSAVKRGENGQGWIVRLYNPFEKSIGGAIRLNCGLTGPIAVQSPVERVTEEFVLSKDKGKKWSCIRTVTLEETPERNLAMDAEGWVNFEIGKKKILTIEFLP
jgi:hypothetical protein